MLRRDVQLDAEEASSGRPSIFVNVYRLIRCPGHLCRLGPYCWVDPNSKKHYKLFRPHLENLIDYVEQGYTLQSYNDVPYNIHQQLYNEAEQSLERRKKTASTSTVSLPPINITNVLPA